MTIPDIRFDHNKANQAEFEVIPLDYLYTVPFKEVDPEEPHRITFFNLIYIEKGTGQHMVDFEQYPFNSGTFIFVQPEQVHAFDFKNKPTGYILIFTQSFLDQVHTNMRLPNYTPTHLNSYHHPLISSDNHDQSRFKTLIEEIRTESQLLQPDPLVVMYLFSALSMLINKHRPDELQKKLTPEQSKKFAAFFRLLQTHYDSIRDANWYAEQIATTYKTLNQICKKATDQTAKQLIDAYTLIEIKRRLAISQTTTQKMAYDLGFDDASNFVKYFKKGSAMTPSQFQHQYRTPKL